jgi:hypothetical protein
MRQPEILVKVHSRAVAARRGDKKRAWWASGTPEVEAAKARLAMMGAMAAPESISKMATTHRARGVRPPWNGGEGRGLTLPQRLLWQALGGPPWQPEYSIPVMPRRPDLPTCLYVDLALPERFVAIEVDGSSHRASVWRERDKRKTAYLASLGWTVLRFSNQDILTWSKAGAPTDAPIALTLRQHDIKPSWLAEPA